MTRKKDERWTEIEAIRNLSGGVLSSFEAWLIVRGMRTLFLRFERASQNALTLATHFERHPLVEKVLYPGLPSHPRHDLAKRQMTNDFGGMTSILVKGTGNQALAVLEELNP